MVFALLARFLLKQPLLVQAVVLGLCTGLFVSALAQANERDPAINATVRLVLIWGAAAAAMFYAGFVVQSRSGEAVDRAAPKWLYAVYAVVWVFGLAAALFALLGEGGFKVAALAIVPLVLLAPTALYGIRMILHRAPA
jgi:hypothetical protein